MKQRPETRRSKVAREDQEILTAEEAAALLRVSPQTVLKESRLGLLPGVKVGREWRYTRTALLRHLEQYTAPEPGAMDEGATTEVVDRR
jgi:excisionase family DNA binding protein